MGHWLSLVWSSLVPKKGYIWIYLVKKWRSWGHNSASRGRISLLFDFFHKFRPGGTHWSKTHAQSNTCFPNYGLKTKKISKILRFHQFPILAITADILWRTWNFPKNYVTQKCSPTSKDMKKIKQKVNPTFGRWDTASGGKLGADNFYQKRPKPAFTAV